MIEKEESDITHLYYGDDPAIDAGLVLDDLFFEQNPHELYYFRRAVPGELARGGYPDYDGTILVVVIKEGVRVRVPCLNEEHGTEVALEYLQSSLGD